MDARRELARKVESALSRFGVQKGSGVLVAVSGGADSTALLSVLKECARLDLRLEAVHVDHGLRPRSEHLADRVFLESLCAALGVAFHVETISAGFIRRTASEEHRSIEEVARELRYALLRRRAAEVDARWIAVGHTKDDQLETVLMRLFQGGLLQGMAGIPAEREGIIRPLLDCSRREVLAYLDERGAGHRSDASNDDESYLRNRVRRRIVPAVAEIFPSVLDAVSDFAAHAGLLNGLLDRCCELLLPWKEKGSERRVPAALFFSAPAEIRVRSVLRLYSGIEASERIPRRFFRPLESAVRRRSGGILLQGHGATIEHRDDFVFWRPDVVLKSKKSYLIHVFEPSMYNITPTLCFTVSTVSKGSAGARVVSLPESLVRHPLVVRSRRPGDAIQMKDGMKSLKKLFNEWGVPESIRDRVPVIEDRSGVWAVAGETLGYKSRIRYHRTPELREDIPIDEIVFAFEYRGDQL